VSLCPARTSDQRANSGDRQAISVARLPHHHAELAGRALEPAQPIDEAVEAKPLQCTLHRSFAAACQAGDGGVARVTLAILDLTAKDRRTCRTSR
jgi:hypothetical protein